MKQHEEDHGKSKKEDRRKKAAGGKSGGGTQGRETKTKATKTKHRGKKGGGPAQDSDSEDDTSSHQTAGPGKFGHVDFLSVDEMQKEVADFPELAECPEELVEGLTDHLHRPLTREFQDVAKSTFEATVAAGGDARRKTHQQLQEKVSALLTTIRLSEKSVKVS